VGATLTSVIALTATANAADMYRREAAVGGYKDGPVYAANSWTGFYAGVNGGYAFSRDSRNITITDLGANVARVPGGEPEGGFGGGQIGYNFGSGVFGSQFVIGVEADIQGSDISDDVAYGAVPGTGSRRTTTNIDWFGTVRGRLGYALDRTLIYATGGFAYGNVDKKIYNSAGSILYKNDDTQTGYAVGGGVEHKISPNWSVKAEYQYVNLGDEKLKIQPGFVQTFGTRDVETDFHTVRVGLNYHIGSTYESLK
jgi:outer membrane immunogenic protein